VNDVLDIVGDIVEPASLTGACSLNSSVVTLDDGAVAGKGVWKKLYVHQS
jgi:hypothetical protein